MRRCLILLHSQTPQIGHEFLQKLLKKTFYSFFRDANNQKYFSLIFEFFYKCLHQVRVTKNKIVCLQYLDPQKIINFFRFQKIKHRDSYGKIMYFLENIHSLISHQRDYDSIFSSSYPTSNL